METLQSFILERAAADAEFRRALLADPREAISRELGLELPCALTFEAVELPSGQLALTLPAGLDAPGTAVAGQQHGFTQDCCCCC